MSSDRVKDALATAYPNTDAGLWKRRVRKKVVAGISRTFEYTDGLTVETIEKSDGSVIVVGLVEIAPVKALTDSAQSVEAAPKAATPQPKTEKAKPVSISDVRKQMVVGSRWRTTEEVTIRHWIANPACSNLKYNDPLRDKMRNAGELVILVDVARLPAGSEFTVVDKIASTGTVAYDAKKHQTNGLIVPVSLIPGLEPLRDMGLRSHDLYIYDWDPNRNYVKVGNRLPLSQIAAVVEPLSIPETLVYALRDRETGEFFGGWEVEKEKRGSGKYAYTSSHTTNIPRMKPKFSSAKKYKTASAVKASIRDFTGYNEGLDEEGEYKEEWVANGAKKIDLPPTWEMVSVNRVTGEVKETFDVQDWFAEVNRLRVLTAGHGSAVRAVYKKAEGNEELDSILVFQNRSRGSYQYPHMTERVFYDHAEAFNESEDDGTGLLGAIKSAIDVMSGHYIRVKTDSTIAVACQLVDGFAAKLAFDYNGDAAVKLLDMATLKEVVDEGEVKSVD